MNPVQELCKLAEQAGIAPTTRLGTAWNRLARDRRFARDLPPRWAVRGFEDHTLADARDLATRGGAR
jgi:hypothetical protein